MTKTVLNTHEAIKMSDVLSLSHTIRPNLRFSDFHLFGALKNGIRWKRCGKDDGVPEGEKRGSEYRIRTGTRLGYGA
jgi:hypothetical protein